MATGPSLTQADVEACRGRARVIAIKDSYRLAPWADALYACDAKWWRRYNGVPEFTGRKYALEPHEHGEPDPDFAPWPDVVVLKNAGLAGLALDPSALRHGYNSGYQAINLAVHLGARRIVLLGYDMQPGPQGYHWFGSHPWQVDIPFGLFLQQFPALVAPLAAAGVEIVNATRSTALTCFPCQPLEACLVEAAA